MNHFFVGQPVVCIDDKFEYVSIDQLLREGQTYTVRWLGMYRSYVDGDFLGIKVEEIQRGKCEVYGHDDPPFAARRFRPLVSDKLAQFRNMIADPDGYKPPAEEGPLHPRLPDEVPGWNREKVEVE